MRLSGVGIVFITVFVANLFEILNSSNKRAIYKLENCYRTRTKLSKTLIFRIECQEDGFRDATSISSLLRTFTLCTVIPKTSASYNSSLETRDLLLDILLAFTTVSLEMSANNPWQTMVSEVVKYLTTYLQKQCGDILMVVFSTYLQKNELTHGQVPLVTEA